MITLRDITLRRGLKVVLDGASATLQPGEKIGLVGRNGAGKSSLFALLTNRLSNDRGEVEVPRHWRRSEVAQNMPETDDGATDFVLEGDLPLMAARAALAAAEAANDVHAMADSLIRAYHVALQTKPLVILPGISGTGKTRLTRLYADAVLPAPSPGNDHYLLVAVQPEPRPKVSMVSQNSSGCADSHCQRNARAASAPAVTIEYKL